MPDIIVPQMGDSISEGSISAVLKQEGASVKIDYVVVQIETDKVTIDVKSTEDGVIQKLLVQTGSIVKPGQVVASVSKAGASSEASRTNPPPTSTPAISSPPPPAATASALSHSEPSHHAGRTPGIHFPNRRSVSLPLIHDHLTIMTEIYAMVNALFIYYSKLEMKIAFTAGNVLYSLIYAPSAVKCCRVFPTSYM
jgi:pyruvate/2-oxoglutarate dehydrogenase complex dihydrolipoamide acyltransferase (E2) component